jgi:phosphate transport system substrate-binding protein
VDGIAPSKENIRNGTYSLTVDLFAVTAGSSNPNIDKLIAWLLSPQGQELIEKTGYVGAATSKD